MTGQDQRPLGEVPLAERSEGAGDEASRLLRRQAEAQLAPHDATLPTEAFARTSPDDTAQLLHELRVHQIELEMQNEELRRAQIELDGTRARWFDLYDAAPVGYCTVGEQGMIVQANLTLTAMLGVPRSSLVTRPFTQLIEAKDQDTWYLLRHRILADGMPRSCELRLVSTEQQPKSAQLTVTAATDERGAAELRVAVIDVTARRQAEQQAQETRALLDAIVDSTPSGIFAMDRQQRFTLVNTAMAQAHGKTKAELLGRTAAELFAPEVADAMRRVNDRIMRTGSTESLEEVHVGRSGQPSRTVLAAKFPLYDAHGVVMGLSGVLTDVTEYRRSEAERISLASQLQQAQKLESIGRLAGGVAHDFNNQLGVILGHTELALARIDPSRPEHEDLTEIRDAAMRSASLTRQLLAFARQQVIQPTVLDLNKTVAHALNMLRRLIGENLDLAWYPGAGLWLVTSDAAQVEQLLTNLVVNARDAISGPGTIIVSTANRVVDAAWCASHADAIPGEYVQITIVDNGCGMSPELLAKIFEPFFTTKAVGEGTGLGLASVYGAVRQNGGFITVESEVGKGTTFAIYLPRAANEGVPTMEPTVPSPLARGRETILLVEDEDALRRLTARVLEGQGYTVLVADGPRRAMQLAHDRSADIALLLTDVVMPEMEGPALAAALLAECPHLRYLFMSGYSVRAIEEASPQRDIEHFLAKPFTIRSLTTKVREVLDRP